MINGATIRQFLNNPRRLRQTILVLFGVVVLVVVVFFNQDFQNLWRWLRGSAAFEWTTRPSVTNMRTEGQLVDVKVSDTERYLYLVGGGTDVVERLRIKTSDGTPEEDAAWTTQASGWGRTYSVHGASKALQYGNYLYIISGDIHVPHDTSLYENPLPFSTIERVNVTDPASNWEPIAILAGVTAMPEVVISEVNSTTNQLHVVGGLFQGADIIDDPTDAGKWNDKYKNLPIIGDPDLLGLPSGTTGVIPGTGGGMGMGGGGVVDSGHVWIAQSSDPPDFAQMLSDNFANGEFVTTVSEHYVVNLSSLNYVGGELGKDYTGTVNNEWTVNGVTGISHLRILIQEYKTPTGNPQYLLTPAPQGRYGHKLVEYNDQIYVLGGASWQSKIDRRYYINPAFDPYYYFVPVSTFWVIDDAEDPISSDVVFGAYDYQFIGNKAYRWQSDDTWMGTNALVNAPVLASKYALSTGRAFFGLVPFEPEPDMPEFLAVGGLENDPDDSLDFKKGGSQGTIIVDALRYSAGTYSIRFPDYNPDQNTELGVAIKIVATTDTSSTTLDGWQSTGNLELDDGESTVNYPAYRLDGMGLNTQVLVFGGQTKFQTSSADIFNNAHVPDYTDDASTRTFSGAYDKDTLAWTWTPEGDTRPANGYATATIRTPIQIVGGEPRGWYIMAYKASGNNTTLVESIGPIAFGDPTVPDPTQSTVEIVPLRNEYIGVDANGDGTNDYDAVPVIWNDFYDYATATVTLRNYYGEPVSPDEHWAVSLYTSRSALPAINKYGAPPALPDGIYIAGQATQGGGSDWNNWQQQVVLADAAGQARFRIVSGYATDKANFPTHETVYAYAIQTTASDPTAGISNLGATPLVVTIKNHPNAVYSSISADPWEVTADGVEESTLTGQVRDYLGDPLPGFTVKIESSRNIESQKQGDDYDPTDADNDVDNISQKTLTPIANGSVTATVNSKMKGFSIIGGYYDIPGWVSLPGSGAPDSPIRGYKTTLVKFSLQGRIVTLLPNTGRQGQPLSPLSATGENTQWFHSNVGDQGLNSKVDFIAPNSWFDLDNSDGLNQCDDINSCYLVADGISPTKFILTTPVGDSDVIVRILSGGGSLLPNYTNQITLHTNVEGKAYFTYVASDTAGILKLEASYAGGNTSKVWLPMLDKSNYFTMDPTAEPPILTSSSEQSTIEALPLSFDANIPASDIEWLTTETSASDGGTVSKFQEGTGAQAYSRYHYVPPSDNVSGIAKIFVIGRYIPGNIKIVGMVTVNKSYGEGGASRDIVFASANANGQPTDINVPSQDQLSIATGISIGGSATIGVWGFVVTTRVLEPNPFDLPNMRAVTYTEMAPFTVTAGTVNTDPYIDTIVPDRGYRGDQDLRVTINGVNTNFISNPANAAHSVVTFTPANTANGGNLAGVTAVVVPNAGTLTELLVDVDITADANVGYWNIVVTTGITTPEVAEMAGNYDFLVTTANGYFVNLTAVPDSLPRDGTSQSHLTAEVGFINELDGSVTYQTGKIVDFDFFPAYSDAGDLDPSQDTTNNTGEAESDYTVDTGEEDDTVVIRATATISTGVFAMADVTIEKIGINDTDPNNLQTTISAVSPVPVDTNGSTAPNPYSTVTVTVRNSIGNPLEGKSVQLSSDRGLDLITPAGTQTTDQDGKTIFRVSSSVVGLATITANIEVNLVQLTAYIRFEPEGVLVERNFKVTTPFQSRDFDNWVKLALKDQDHSGQGYTDFNETYQKNARNAATDPNVLDDLKAIPFYLYADSTYTVWAKGRSHLAVNNTNVTAGTATELPVSFASANGNKGLLIGDVVVASGNDNIIGNFHDNVINVADWIDTVQNWHKDSDPNDFNNDGDVNTGDLWFIFVNQGVGATKP